jgi:hypothetical protein
MPLAAGRPETRTMRYAMAILLGALALLVPMAGSAAADQNAAELLSAGTAQIGAGKRDKATVDKRDKVKGCEKVRRPRRR